MNTITQEENKLDKFCREGYKIIYPNSIDGLDFEVIIKEKHQFSDPTILSPIKESRNCKCFNFYEKLFKYKGILFLIPYYFVNTSTREYSLRFDKGEASKEFNLEWIHIVSDSNEQRNYTDFYEKINYVLYNPKKDRLVFYIDEKFQSSEAKRLKRFKKKERERKSKEEEHLQKQQKEISVRISKLLD